MQSYMHNIRGYIWIHTVENIFTNANNVILHFWSKKFKEAFGNAWEHMGKRQTNATIASMHRIKQESEVKCHSLVSASILTRNKKINKKIARYFCLILYTSQYLRCSTLFPQDFPTAHIFVHTFPTLLYCAFQILVPRIPGSK